MVQISMVLGQSWGNLLKQAMAEGFSEADRANIISWAQDLTRMDQDKRLLGKWAAPTATEAYHFLTSQHTAHNCCLEQ